MDTGISTIGSPPGLDCHLITPENLLGMPCSSLGWNLGRVEKMRQRVDTTTNMQETTATTYIITTIKLELSVKEMTEFRHYYPDPTLDKDNLCHFSN